MATLLDILRFEYPGALWTLDGEDDYARLVWHQENSTTKPSEAELRAKSASADAKKADFLARLTAEQQLHAVPDPVIKGFEVVLYTLEEIIRALPVDIRANIDTSRAVRMRNRLSAIRTDPGD